MTQGNHGYSIVAEWSIGANDSAQPIAGRGLFVCSTPSSVDQEDLRFAPGVCSPVCQLTGTVTSYNKVTRKHHVIYDDGDERDYTLAERSHPNWEPVLMPARRRLSASRD
jgi:hypothetical protein